jgi:DNA-binding MarR family transcriptional regulator
MRYILNVVIPLNLVGFPLKLLNMPSGLVYKVSRRDIKVKVSCGILDKIKVLDSSEPRQNAVVMPGGGELGVGHATESDGVISKPVIEALASFRYLLRRFLRYSEDRAVATGITPQQYQLILAIEGQPGREWATVGDLATALQIHHNAAVGLVTRCERAGLVKRTRDKVDRRQVCVEVTEYGRAALRAIASENLGELKDLLSSLEMLFRGGPVNLRQAVMTADAVETITDRA